MGLKKLIGLVDKGVEIADKVIVDKDKKIELEKALETLRVQLLLTGKGAGITKITICALVSTVVLTGTICFITGQDMTAFKDYAMSVTPIIGTLIGVYGAGKAVTTKYLQNGAKK